MVKIVQNRSFGGDARYTDMVHAKMVNIGQLVREHASDKNTLLVGFGTACFFLLFNQKDNTVITSKSTLISTERYIFLNHYIDWPKHGDNIKK
jgi:hypothetical protein